MGIPSEYLTLKTLAVHTSVSRSTLIKWIACGMPCYKIGRCIRFKKSEIDSWLQQFRLGADTNSLDDIWDEVMEEV